MGLLGIKSHTVGIFGLQATFAPSNSGTLPFPNFSLQNLIKTSFFFSFSCCFLRIVSFFRTQTHKKKKMPQWAVTHADLEPSKSKTDLSSKTGAFLMVFTILIGLLCFILCLIAEATRSEVQV